MSTKKLRCACLASALVCLVQAAAALSAPVAVDFGYTGHSTVQPGFTGLQGGLGSSSTVTQSVGGLSVSVGFPTPSGSGLEGFYDRGALSNNPPSFTYADLYNGFAYTNATSDPIHISIANVVPNLPYAITLYSYDPVLNDNSSETTTFTTTNTTTGGPGSVTYGKSAPTSNNEFATTLIVESTTSTLDILAQASPVAPEADGTRVNAFVLVALPEPSTVLMLGLAGSFLGLVGMWRRQGRKAG